MSRNNSASANTPQNVKKSREDVQCSCKADSRNLVVCIDGTSNQFGPKNTNVVELYSRLVKDSKQLTFYNSNIGTYATPSKSFSYFKQVVYNKMDLAFAWRFEKVVIEAYRWLSEKYEPGDRIFLFGFSRGAYQIRALAAMIGTVGLIHQGNEAQIPFAYDLYMRASGDKTQSGDSQSKEGEPQPEEPRVEDAENRSKINFFSDDEDFSDPHRRALQFKETFSREKVKVHFVGAWDTVSSVGLARTDKKVPPTTGGTQHACYFRHALALDEWRIKFLPEYAHGGVSLPPATREEEKSQSGPLQKRPISTLLNGLSGEKTVSGYALICEKCYQHNGLVKESELKRKYRCPGCKHLNSYDLSKADLSSELGLPATNKPPHTDATTPNSTAPLLDLTVHSQRGTRSNSVDVNEIVSPTSPGEPSKRASKPHAKEVWFSGTRADIGGGTKENSKQKFYAPAFQWMMHEAMLAGLLVRPLRSVWSGPVKETQSMHKSPIPRWWWAFEVLPIKRLSYKKSTSFTYLPHLGASRKVAIGQLIHGSVEHSDLKDKIKAQIPSQYWAKGEGGDGEISEIWIEPNLFDQASNHLKSLRETEFKDESVPMLEVLREISSTPQGQLSLRDIDDSAEILYKILCDLPVDDESTAVPRLIMSILNNFASGSLTFYKVPPVIQNLMKGSSGDQPARKFLRQFRTAEVKRVSAGLFSSARSVAFAPNDTLVVSGFTDGTVRLWDTATDGATLKIFQRHKRDVLTVAFSPDGESIASGSEDHTVRVWDVQSGDMRYEPLKHDDYVHAVAFSPPSEFPLIASGCGDGSAFLWNAETGALHRELIGHKGGVYSIAFSSDGAWLVSGSSDQTICIWDTATGKMRFEPLAGHTRSVCSVAFSPNGERIVSGSYDDTARVWDAKTGEALFTFKGHDDDVNVVAFSPDSARIASGSDDCTIRVWDANTGRAVFEPFKDRGSVYSLAYSQNGRYIVSGSNDGIIHLWDIAGEKGTDPDPIPDSEKLAHGS